MNKPKSARGSEIDIAGIMARIPHRYPMLLIDRVVDIVGGESCTGIKNVSANEPCFQGHFPGYPIMPGVLIIEAMAQTSATLVVSSLDGVTSDTHVVYFMTIESARFRKPVVPGDQLHIKVKKDRQRGNVWKFRGEAYVDETLCAEAVYTAMLVAKDDVPADAGLTAHGRQNPSDRRGRSGRQARPRCGDRALLRGGRRRQARRQSTAGLPCRHRRPYLNWRSHGHLSFRPLGHPPQDLKYKGEPSKLEIGIA